MITKEAMLAFEADIKQEFLAAHIRAPIHLSRGNEDVLIDIFKAVEPQDWVFSTWRSHYHALLKGIDPAWRRAEIMAGRSVSIMLPEHRFLSSAIAGGIASIALGVAMGIERMGSDERAWCFVGDMAAPTGVYGEALRYASGHDLPITFVVEDNGLSTETPTKLVWGVQPGCNAREHYYEYERKEAHVGAGKWVQFG